MSWSPQQSAAIRQVIAWLKDPKGAQVFRLFGYAGTGKTTIAKEIAANVPGKVIFAAFTGKAALVLQSKGCRNASTIHSLIYKLDDDSGSKPKFVRNPDSDIKTAKLVCIDECSMVDELLGRDLESFGVRILVLGDPAQLPPVKGQGYFTAQRPDVLLTEIHRQAADNPIIRMSMEIREGKRLQVGSYGDSKVIRRSDLKQGEVLASDQLLVGLNRTRRNFNLRLRQLHGIDDPMPVNGDKLICLKNNKDKGILNGSLWTAHGVRYEEEDPRLMLAVAESADGLGSGLNIDIAVPVNFFEGTEEQLAYWLRRELDEFDYGYAITCHKAQGSQWDNVMLFDESGIFRENTSNWLYTGVTRAAERITVVV